MGFPNSADCGLAKVLSVLCDNAYDQPAYPILAKDSERDWLGKCDAADYGNLGEDSVPVSVGFWTSVYGGIPYRYLCPLPNYLSAQFDQAGSKTVVIAFSGVEPMLDSTAFNYLNNRGYLQTVALAVALAQEMTPDRKSLAVNQRWSDMLYRLGWSPGVTANPALMTSLKLDSNPDHIILCGHSWGGCFALMLASYLQEWPTLRPKISCVHTFGMPRFNGADVINGTAMLSQRHWIAAGDLTPGLPPNVDWPIVGREINGIPYAAHPRFCDQLVVDRVQRSWRKFCNPGEGRVQMDYVGTLSVPLGTLLPSDALLKSCEDRQGFAAFTRAMAQAHLPSAYANQIEKAELNLLAELAAQTIPTAPAGVDQTLAQQYLDHESTGDLQTWLAGLGYDQAEVRAWENGIVATQPSGPPSAPGTRGTGTGDRVQTNPVPYRRHRHRNAVTTH